MDLNSSRNLEKALFEANPHLLAVRYSTENLLFPPKVLEFFNYVYNKAKNRELARVIVKAPRGGGKSRVLASIELALWWILDFDVVNLGGSFRQASKVYSYLNPAFCSNTMDKQLEKSIQVETRKKNYGAAIYVLAATEKQTRSPHVGGPGRGGALIIDEECEAEESVVKSAIPVVNTADPSLIIRSSTFHKAFGTYQECWDKAPQLGYKRFSWDIFDVSRKCGDDCKKVYDPITGETGPCNVLDFCNGKAHTSEGWVKIDEIRQARREMGVDEFEIELMGERPSSHGLVYPAELVETSRCQEIFELLPMGSTSVGVDWGFEGQCALHQLQQQKSETKNKMVIRVIRSEAYTHYREEEIYAIVQDMTQDWQIPIYADQSHPFQNASLENRGASLFRVNFAKLKDYGISNIKKWFEDKVLEIPDQFDWLIDQLKKYRRNPLTGKPIKKRDHGPDSLLCAGLHFTNEGFGMAPDNKLIEVVDPYKNRRQGY